MTELVTFDFWQTVFAETAEGLRQSTALWVAGVGDGLPRAGDEWDAAALAVADARAGSAFAAIWSQHQNMPAAEEVRMFLAALDPALPDCLSAESLRGVTATYEEPVLTHALASGAREVVTGLQAAGLVLGVISNTGRIPGTVLLAHLGLPTEVPRPRPPPARAADLFSDMPA